MSTEFSEFLKIIFQTTSLQKISPIIHPKSKNHPESLP
ncbi:conserved hypothetical protein [Streptococcus pneumoniae 70585]|uniref:Uncharacterized protein n=1 Tax=Streptococcus pneumoniae (strain 70585) TaxID=488221 RepID=C1CBE6_STRP7|nr:conserved hypothetical protein [Streptococcus pneumoniae 70585]